MGSGGWVGLGVTLGAADRVATDGRDPSPYLFTTGMNHPWRRLQ